MTRFRIVFRPAEQATSLAVSDKRNDAQCEIVPREILPKKRAGHPRVGSTATADLGRRCPVPLGSPVQTSSLVRQIPPIPTVATDRTYDQLASRDDKSTISSNLSRMKHDIHIGRDEISERSCRLPDQACHLD